MKAKRTSLRTQSRARRRARVRKKIVGTDQRPRLSVFRSLKYTYAQLISDKSGRVIAAASTKDIPAEGNSAKSKDSAKLLGKVLAEKAKAANVQAAVFDRNGYVYHGRVAAVAEGAREGGLAV